MRTLRTLLALACVSGALLIGAAAPAQAAPPVTAQAATQGWTPGSPFHFGTYYTIEYCHYYGQSLTSGPQFDSYSCYPYWYPNDPTQYWALYVW